MADTIASYLGLSLIVAVIFGTWFGLWCWRDDLARKPVLDGKDYGVLVGSSLIVGGFFFVLWPAFAAVCVFVLGGRVLRGAA